MKKFHLYLASGGAAGGFACGVGVELDQILEKGLHANVAAVSATSAGVGSMVYLLSYPQDFEYHAKKIWTEALIDARFINKKNIFSDKPIMDIDYLVDGVFFKQFPLDVAKICGSKITFCFNVFCTNSNSYVKVGNRESSKILFTQENAVRFIKSSMAVPFLFQKKIEIAGRTYIDGGLGGVLDIGMLEHTDKTLLIVNSNSIGGFGDIIRYPCLALSQVCLGLFFRKYRLHNNELYRLVCKGWNNRKAMNYAREAEQSGQVLIIEPLRKIGSVNQNDPTVLRDNFNHGREVVHIRKQEIMSFLDS